jgi:hypothetical protein
LRRDVCGDGTTRPVRCHSSLCSGNICIVCHPALFPQREISSLARIWRQMLRGKVTASLVCKTWWFHQNGSMSDDDRAGTKRTCIISVPSTPYIPICMPVFPSTSNTWQSISFLHTGPRHDTGLAWPYFKSALRRSNKDHFNDLESTYCTVLHLLPKAGYESMRRRALWCYCLTVTEVSWRIAQTWMCILQCWTSIDTIPPGSVVAELMKMLLPVSEASLGPTASGLA